MIIFYNLQKNTVKNSERCWLSSKNCLWFSIGCQKRIKTIDQDGQILKKFFVFDLKIIINFLQKLESIFTVLSIFAAHVYCSFFEIRLNNYHSTTNFLM